MLNINKTYVTNSKKKPIAVQIDIHTFERIEQILEDYALGKLIEENDPEDNLMLNEAEQWYRKLKTRDTDWIKYWCILLMNVLVNKKFLKELTTLPEKERKKIEKFVFKDTANYLMLSQIPNLGKLKGYRNYYKIRFGDYRIGLRYEDDTLIFERVLHRKDIYKYYP